MRCLLDANILVRAVNAIDPHYATVHRAIDRLLDAHQLCLVPQCVYEFWSVASRPINVNGLGLTPDVVEAHVDLFLKSYDFYDDGRSLFDHWRILVRRHQCIGKPSHDARLVAAMMTHRIDRVLTFNVADFVRFPDIIVLDPRVVASTTA